MGLEEASVLGNETKVGNATEDTVEFFRTSTRHDVDSVALVEKKIVENIECSLRADGDNLVDRTPSNKGTLIVNDEQTTLSIHVLVR